MPRSEHIIVDAPSADLPQILAIYNEVIRNSTAVFSEDEFTEQRGKSWWQAKLDSGWPFIVAHDSAGVAGFGTFGDFRAFPGYRRTVEHSVHVRADCRGNGIGRALISELKRRAALMHKHVMIAGIDADNAVSVGLHASLGFVTVGHLHEVAFKFGRPLDLIFMQCIIPATERECSTDQP